MSYTYKIELIEELPEDIPLEKTGSITTEKEWFGSTFGECVGKILDTGEKESFFRRDRENNNTVLLDILVESGKCKCIHREMYNRENKKSYKATFIYVMHRVVDHCSDKPTITAEALDTPMNVEYEFTYEILLVANDEYKRYITKTIKTKGPYTYSLMDVIENIEQMFEEWIEDGEQGFRYSDEEIEVKFYNEVGEENHIPFENMRHLLMSINSVRIIDFKSKLVK